MTIKSFLESQDDAWKKTEVDKKEFGVIPEGKYQAIVKKVDFFSWEKENVSPDKMKLRWNLQIIGPSHQNRYVNIYNDLSGDYLKYTKANLSICGFEIEKLSDILKIISKLDGLNLDLFIKVRTYNNKAGEKKEANSVYINKLIKDYESPENTMGEDNFPSPF